jgi:DNA-binding transcriptional MerR regulator
MLAREGRYRVFDKDAHQRMTFITLCNQIGLTLPEIGGLVPFFDAPKGERCKASLKVIADKKASQPILWPFGCHKNQ